MARGQLTDDPDDASASAAGRAGGFVGSVGRYLRSGRAHSLAPRVPFPIGTLAVNAVGCQAIGILGGLWESRGLLSAATRVLLMIIVLGGLTTLSTFGFESFRMLEDGQRTRAATRVGLPVVIGIAAVWAGHVAGRAL